MATLSHIVMKQFILIPEMFAINIIATDYYLQGCSGEV